MYTLQASRKIDAIKAPSDAPKWFNSVLQELKDGIRDMVGQCNASLEHRGPVKIENTHPNDDTERPGGEPALTLCTRAANDTLPESMTALKMECGDIEANGATFDGDVTHNGCVVFNQNLAVYGCLTSFRNGWALGAVRFCLTSAFSGGCATAVIVEATYDGNCKPTYASTGAAINVIDRTGQWARCSTSGQCGYASFFGYAQATTNCELGAAAACNGWYEVMNMDPPSGYTECMTDVVDKVCCLAASLVVCRKTICFSTPIKVGVTTCGGSAGTVCSSYTPGTTCT
jgi:hypothetical protein